ncbi:uncharacterized protein LOC129176701 [Dunckerocampus dactyliophorus]|uniref:uncharacterized protein LOC129176701 n=1 Tax=Dunckerocampus dactyliophorus TaxID=161453 RepID=UPI0024058EE1|nr:uncharacterized protein LOC129176701 [Dunckerocampus dactyliophorus]
MSNESTTPWLSNSSALAVNACTVSPTVVLELTATSDIISTANRVYDFCATVGFVAGCFLLYSFVQTYRAQRRLAWLNRLLWSFCGFQLLLLSLSIVVDTPPSLKTSILGCAALSFTINTTYLCGLFVLVLMAYVLALDPPSNALLRRPGVCVALVGLTSALTSLLLAAIRGPKDELYQETECFMDPVQAGVSYALAKLCLSFLLPYILKLGLVICGCVRQSKSNGRFLSGSEEGPVFLGVTAVSLLCQLFYTVSLVRGAQLQADSELSHRERAFVSVAELVFFSASSANLILVLFTHKPSRERIGGLFRQLTDCCTCPMHTQANRNIITPHIEITDTLQDIEL